MGGLRCYGSGCCRERGGSLSLLDSMVSSESGEEIGEEGTVCRHVAECRREIWLMRVQVGNGLDERWVGRWAFLAALLVKSGVLMGHRDGSQVVCSSTIKKTLSLQYDSLTVITINPSPHYCKPVAGKLVSLDRTGGTGVTEQ